MKLLNLDDIVLNSERTVRYKGVTYQVRDFNVEEFIKFQTHFGNFRKAYNSDETADMQVVINETKELVKLGVPDFPVEEVGNLNPVQMLALVSMIANLIPEADAATSEVMEEKKETPEGPVA